jgi:hypothetical protein
MAKKSSMSPDTIKEYDAIIQAGKKHLATGSADWSKWTQYLVNNVPTEDGGARKQSDLDGDPMINFNGPWLTAKTILSDLAYRMPIPEVVPKRPKLDENARAMEAVLTYFTADGMTDLHFELKQAITEAIFKNKSYIKQGYVKSKTPNKINAELLKRRETQDERDKLSGKIKRVMNKSKDVFGQVSLDIHAPMEGWWCQRVPANHILVPPGVERLKDAPWMIHVIFKDVYEAIEAYPDLEGLVEPTNINIPTADEPLGEQPGTKPLLQNKYVIYEVYDRRDPNNKRILHFTDMVTDSELSLMLLKETAWTLPCDDFPISELSFNFVPGMFYSPPDIQFYLPFSDAITETLNNYQEGTRENVPVFGYRSGMDESTIRRIRRAKRRLFLPLNAQTDVWRVEGKAPQIEYGYLNALKMFFDEFSGIDSTGRGSPGRSDTATELMFLKQGSQAKREAMAAATEEFVSDVLKKQGQFAQKLASPNMTIRIAPHLLEQFDNNQWKEIRREDIQGDFLYRIKVGSMRQSPSEEEKKKSFDLYNVAANDPYFDPYKVRKEFVEGYFGEIDPSKYLRAENDPDAGRAIQMEHMLALSMQQIPPASQGENHNMHMEHHSKFMQAPTGQIAEQLAVLKSQAAPFIQQASQQGVDPQTVIPQELKQQIQEQYKRWKTVTDIMQEHLQSHQEIDQEQINPVNYNLANQSSQRYGSEGAPQTKVSAGGSAPTQG